MEATPDQADASAHERFSAECFNACWELIEKDERTPEDDEEMLNLAHASAWHWSKRPDFAPSKRVIALWQLSRVNSLLGQGEVALGHATRALEAARDINAMTATAIAGDMPAAATDTVPAGVRADAPPNGDLEDEPAFLLGYAHEAAARAHSVLGDREKAEFHRSEAWRLADEVQDAEARERLLSDLESLRGEPATA